MATLHQIGFKKGRKVLWMGTTIYTMFGYESGYFILDSDHGNWIVKGETDSWQVVPDEFSYQEFSINYRDAKRIVESLEYCSVWDKTDIYYRLKEFVDSVAKGD